jgi:hypothetical protein
MNYVCPVCLFSKLPYPPRDYHICPCCSTEFGNDDAEFTHEQLREMWIAGGARWFFGNPPLYWNPWMQLIEARLEYAIPSYKVRTALNATVSEFDQPLDLSQDGWRVRVAA